MSMTNHITEPGLQELTAPKLRWRCDLSRIPFETTAQAPRREGFVGQEPYRGLVGVAADRAFGAVTRHVGAGQVAEHFAGVTVAIGGGIADQGFLRQA